jgi:hypothetical protein
MRFLSYEDQADTIAVNAWEQWTMNGLRMDEEEREETMKAARDAAANTWFEGIDELEWLRATVARLRGV